MAKILAKLETAFPKLGDNSPAGLRVKEIVNYLFQQKEALRYELGNLKKENFSKQGYEQLVEDAAKRAVELMKEET